MIKVEFNDIGVYRVRLDCNEYDLFFKLGQRFKMTHEEMLEFVISRGMSVIDIESKNERV